MKIKSLILCAVVAMIALLLPGCKGSTPGSAYKSYAEQLQSKNYEGYVEGYDFSSMAGDTAKVNSTKQALIGLLKMSEAEMEKKGGIKSIEIIEETIQPGDSTAIVKARITYGDGSNNEGQTEMVRRDGEWKMMLNK
ncbi:MAG: DUF4878 domain-containing protein [Muribaculaceae bacterium]|nr:DUF4878 domain-containing protein [Muribaculaceae bacterium]